MIKPSKSFVKMGIPGDFVFLSKTVSEQNENVAGIDVETHCRIAGYVAQKLVSTFPKNVSRFLFVKSAPLIAAAHDIGKINPDFQKMIYDCAAKNEREMKILNAMNANTQSAKRGGKSFHAKVSEIFLREFRKNLPYIAQIEGMHHGFRPDSAPYSENCYGGEDWTRARKNLLEKLEAEFSAEIGWQEIRSWNEARIVGGLVIVSDWIASGGKFAFLKSGEKLGAEKIKEMAENAVADAGFHKIFVKKNLSFSDIFGFEPRKIQKSFFDCVNSPGVYVLEAPMGIGKTEAALYAAYKILSEERASGLYFALPTQLTSNKIRGRVESFLEKILENREKSDSLKLIHSSAWLEKTFGEDGDFGGSWFDGKKRELLAPFAVGTVDQALMSVLEVKHAFVRSFALAGKVVILDEIHSYDAYTGTLLNALVESLFLSGCTVILLSATLTENQKKNILCAKNHRVFEKSYPLVTFKNAIIKKSQNQNQTDSIEESELKEIGSDAVFGNDVRVDFCENDSDGIETALEKSENGEQVLWICNTVQKAQEVFKILGARCAENIECGLVHSRFEKIVRTENEEYWVSIFGKNSKKRGEKGRILVGTQVLEQSLDIDADFLITEICPTDMLFQRLGRLWRHDSNRRPPKSECACLIIAPNFDDALQKKNAFGASGIVYSEYVLCRTLELWKDKKRVSIPGQIRDFLEKTYFEREENGLWDSYKKEMLQKKKKLESFANFSATKEKTFENTKSESSVQTRYSEIENVNVLLMRSIEPIEKDSEKFWKIQFLSGEIILMSQNGKSLLKNERAKISKAIFEHCVCVAEKNAPAYDKSACIFADYVYVGNGDDEKPFRFAIVGNDGVLLTMQKNPCESQEKRFFYNRKIGYQAKNIN